MKEFYNGLNELFKYDPGKRGLLEFIPRPDLAKLSGELATIERAIIVTGFPILAKGKGETDGPSGAANIARALKISGKDVCLVSDDCSYELVRASAAVFDLPVKTYNVPRANSEEYCRDLLNEFGPSHVISIERPGKINGHYRNMGGHLIDHLVSDTDSLFSDPATVTIAIGDGGNELGMGNFKECAAEAGVAFADLTCDYPLAAGVSNWWGWGIAALISLNMGRNILPSYEEEERILKAMLSAGAIDGITKETQMSVDNISFEDNMEFLRNINQLVDGALDRKNCR